MGLRKGISLVGVDDAVLSDRHGIALDVLGDAFAVTRLELELERFGCGE